MPCERRPRSDSEADLYWKNIETTTVPISQDLQELIRADLKKLWYWERLEKSRWKVKVNWYTDDTHRVVLKDETGTVTPKQFLLFCNKATAFYYLQTAHHKDSRGNMTLIPGIIFAMIAREWLQYHTFKPNIEFKHYFANPVRIATGGPSDVPGIIQAHKSLCRQSSELMIKARQGDLWDLGLRGVNLDNYDIHPLYKAVILLCDDFNMRVEPDSNDVFDLQEAVYSQTILIVRTGEEVGLSSPISFSSLKGKTLPLKRPELGENSNVEVIRTSLADGIRFVCDLEEKEFRAYPQSVHNCGSDQRLNPSSPTWTGKSEDASKDPDTWADALIEAGNMYGYDEDDATRISIRRVQAAMIGENFAELVPIPFRRKWKE
ncbi:MAG: hypothetical protein Q9167_005470 [Letrouitia subvulpina]